MSTVLLPEKSATKPPNSDDALYEIVNGNRVELPSIGIYAAMLASELHLLLGAFVKQKRLGRAIVEGLFILDAEAKLRRRPDVAYVSTDRWPLGRAVPETGDWEVVPDLAIEVVSVHDTYFEVLAKCREYFKYGVKQVWVVSPLDRSIYVYDAPERVRIVGGREVLTDTIVPGFALNLAELFPPAT